MMTGLNVLVVVRCDRTCKGYGWAAALGCFRLTGFTQKQDNKKTAFRWLTMVSKLAGIRKAAEQRAVPEMDFPALL